MNSVFEEWSKFRRKDLREGRVSWERIDIFFDQNKRKGMLFLIFSSLFKGSYRKHVIYNKELHFLCVHHL